MKSRIPSSVTILCIGGLGLYAAEPAPVPDQVQALQVLLNQWFKLVSAEEVARLEPLYHPNTRGKVQQAVEQMGKLLPFVAERPSGLLLAKYTDTIAEAVTVPFKVDHPQFSGEVVLTLHLRWADDQWRVLHHSCDSLQSVVDSYDHFLRWYPAGHIWVDPTGPDWIRPEPTDEAEGLRVEALFQGIPPSWPGQALKKKLHNTVYNETVFKSYFPDDPNAGKALVALWRQRSKSTLSMDEILQAARQGLRHAGSTAPSIISWLGNENIWSPQEQNPVAIELMLHASYRADLASNAVYYGLSVVRPRKSPEILERFVELCMIDQSGGRILWGARSQREEMRLYLKPWLEHEDPEVRARAAVLDQVFTGELDYAEYNKQQKIAHDKALYGDTVPQLRQILATGTSRQRRKLFGQIKSRGLVTLFDATFKESLVACLHDGHPEVRRAALSFGGDILCPPGHVDAEMIALMDRLSRDTDPKVRERVAVFTGSHWIWGIDPQHPQAIDIMMRLAQDSHRGTRNDAVYYGLSVLLDKDERVVKVLIDLAVDPTADADLDRIAWGLQRGADRDLIQSLLASHLKGNTRKARRAQELHSKIFNGEK